MGRDRAAYMREYRKRNRTARIVYTHSEAMAQRISELEEEVRHLKAELAKRPDGKRLLPGGHGVYVVDAPTFNTRPFTPVPKVRK